MHFSAVRLGERFRCPMPRKHCSSGTGHDKCMTAIDQSRPLLWCVIARSVPGRSNKDCRRRGYNSLSTSLVKGFWTESEDERMWTAVQKHGPQWVSVAQEVRMRNPDQCSSHWSQKLNPDIDVSEWSLQDVCDMKSAPQGFMLIRT